MANENKDKFIHICHLMDSFVQTMRKSESTHPDLVIEYEEDTERLEVSLNAQVTFKNLKYGHWILFFYDKDGWHVDNIKCGITELTDTWITDELHQRFNIFQSATLDAIKFTNAFCEEKRWKMEAYTPRNIQKESIVIVIYKQTDSASKPYFTIHLRKNPSFDDKTVHGVLHCGINETNSPTYVLEFETIDTFRQHVKDMYDLSNPFTTAQMWQAIGKISTLLEQHVMLA